MLPFQERAPPEALAQLADLGEHLERAQKVLRSLPFPPGPPGPPASEEEGEDFAPLQVLATAQEAFAGFVELIEGVYLPAQGVPRIALQHSGLGTKVFVDAALSGEQRRREIETFIAKVRAADARLMRLAELLGLLMGLAARWAAAGFAPPVVLGSLQQVAPKIVKLGRLLG